MYEGIGYAIMAIMAAAGIYQADKAQDSQEEAKDMQNAQEKVRQVNQRRRSVRDARVATAKANQAASNVGIGGSSLNIGGTGAVQSQLSSGIANMNQEGRANQEISGKLTDASRQRTRGSQFQAVGNLFGTLESQGVFK